MTVSKAIMMAKTDNAVEFADAIKSEINKRVSSALDQKKIELAQGLFTGEYSAEEE
jgi:hypothetical protein